MNLLCYLLPPEWFADIMTMVDERKITRATGKYLIERIMKQRYEILKLLGLIKQ